MAKIGKPESGQENSAPGESQERQLDYRHKLFLRILAVMSAATTSFLGVVLVTQPQVPISAAQEFFDRYYGQVTQVDYRKMLYSEDLSRDFQESVGSDREEYSNWWKNWKQVDVRKVESDPNNPLEFTVWLTYYPVHGSSSSEEDDFTVVCSSFWASVEARIPALGCSVNHIQIQSQLPVSGTV
jgi:hypothetical protein